MVAILVIIARTLGTDEVKIAKQRALVISDLTRPVAQVKRPIASGSSGFWWGGATSDPLAADDNPGKRVYESLCASCHGSGLPNIPQFSKPEDWKDRIAQGNPLMYERAIKGFTGVSGMAMPAKGGNTTLSDDEIRAAVDYMVTNSQAPAPAEPTP